MPLPVLVIEVPAPPPRPPPRVAVIWGASTLNVAAVPPASVALPRSVRLFTPSKATLPAIESGLSTVRPASLISRAPLASVRVPVPSGPLVITGMLVVWMLSAPIIRPLSPATE